MFDKTQYKLLIEEYMNEYDVSYSTAKTLISIKQINDHMNKYDISYQEAVFDIINNYNVVL